jgi:hypothetical protein
MRRRTKGEETDGRGDGEGGARDGDTGGGAGKKGGGGRLEVEGGADRWAPPVGDRVRERGRGGAGGPVWAENRSGPRLG